VWAVTWLSCVLSCGGLYRVGADEKDDSPSNSAGGSSPHGGEASAGKRTGGGSSTVPPMVDVCEQQQQSYVLQRQQLIDQFASFGCTQDADCLTFYDQSPCDSSCSKVITTGARRAVVDGIDLLAHRVCSEECLVFQKPACPVPPTAVCVAEHCVPGAK
jgi:hypothetical protein